jgi:hypothetical protein
LHRQHDDRAERRRSEPVEPRSDTDFVASQVDLILDKINAHGIQSLTKREREILEAAGKKKSQP